MPVEKDAHDAVWMDAEATAEALSALKISSRAGGKVRGEEKEKKRILEERGEKRKKKKNSSCSTSMMHRPRFSRHSLWDGCLSFPLPLPPSLPLHHLLLMVTYNDPRGLP